MSKHQTRKHPSPRRLTRAKRLEARFLAEEGMAELRPERDILRDIEARFCVSEQAARDVYLEAWHGLSKAEAEDRAQRRGQMERVLTRLYRKCWEARQWNTCARVAKELKDLFGLDAPIKVEGLVLGQSSAEEERSDADLDYYSEHGHWPEEAPRKIVAPPSADPLARLH